LSGHRATATLDQVSRTRASLAAFLLALGLLAVGSALWMLHGDAWGLGGRAPVLDYDSAQVALAARELATHGRLATTFAVPLELARHARPPWPLAVVRPGLVVAEAALFRLVPPVLHLGPFGTVRLARPDQREVLAVVLPFCCFLLIGLVLAIATSRILLRHTPWLPEGRRLAAAFTVALAFYLDPEAQHFAIGGTPELPLTLGLALAFAALALDQASRRPLLYGLLLGVAGTLGGDLIWIAPLLAAGAVALAPRGRRVRVLALALAGFALPLVPWWLYRWRAFGSPAWDLAHLAIWDHVEGRTWFSLVHLPEPPVLPAGAAALRLLVAKIAGNLPRLLLDALTGVRALWLGALVAWLAIAWPWRRPSPLDSSSLEGSSADVRPLAVGALVLLAGFALGVLGAAASFPWLRLVFPARVVLEAAGLLALWGLLTRSAELARRPLLRRLLHLAVGLLALGWGSLQTVRGNAGARAAAVGRDLPGTLSLMQITVLMNREIPAGEAVMSNLGPSLAWTASRPVLHLALSPEDVEDCRRRLEFTNVLLVFRNAASAWPEWREVVADPGQAPSRPEWNVRRAREWRTADGFDFIWLELRPPRGRFAAGPG
jgi:hypothetical protein